MAVDSSLADVLLTMSRFFMRDRGHREEDKASDDSQPDFEPASSAATGESQQKMAASVSDSGSNNSNVAKAKARREKEEHTPLYRQTIAGSLEETAMGVLEALASGGCNESISGFAEQDQVCLGSASREVLVDAIERALGKREVNEVSACHQPEAQPPTPPICCHPPSSDLTSHTFDCILCL